MLYDVKILLSRPVEGPLEILLAQSTTNLGAIAAAADYLNRVGKEIFPDATVVALTIEAV